MRGHPAAPLTPKSRVQVPVGSQETKPRETWAFSFVQVGELVRRRSRFVPNLYQARVAVSDEPYFRVTGRVVARITSLDFEAGETPGRSIRAEAHGDDGGAAASMGRRRTTATRPRLVPRWADVSLHFSGNRRSRAWPLPGSSAIERPAIDSTGRSHQDQFLAHVGSPRDL